MCTNYNDAVLKRGREMLDIKLSFLPLNTCMCNIRTLVVGRFCWRACVFVIVNIIACDVVGRFHAGD